MKRHWLLACIMGFSLGVLNGVDCKAMPNQEASPVSPDESLQPLQYRFSRAWGEMGSEPGQFNQPIGIVVKGDRVFVSDSGNHRIQVFDREGTFLHAFGQEGEELGELNQPMSLGLHGDTLYVAEYLGDRVQKFSLSGQSQGTFGTPGTEPGQFDAPSDVALDQEGRAYVVDFYNQRVQVFDPIGNFVRQYGETKQSGSEDGQFNYPTGAAISPKGNLFVADAYNNRIQVFQLDGTLINKWDGSTSSVPESFDGRFKIATAVTVSPQENIYVADFYSHRIQIFSASGEFRGIFGLRGTDPGQLDRPTDIAIDQDGAVYVVDHGNNRIQKFLPAATSNLYRSKPKISTETESLKP